MFTLYNFSVRHFYFLKYLLLTPLLSEIFFFFLIDTILNQNALSFNEINKAKQCLSSASLLGFFFSLIFVNRFIGSFSSPHFCSKDNSKKSFFRLRKKAPLLSSVKPFSGKKYIDSIPMRNG